MIKRVIDGLYKILYILAACGFALLIIILFAQVFTRNVLNFTSGELDEFSKFLFVWLMYIGISMAVYKEKHISIEFLVDHLTPKMQKTTAVINACLTIVLFIVLTIYGLEYATSTMRMNSPVLSLALGTMYACVPISSAISILFCVVRIYRLFVPEKTEES